MSLNANSVEKGLLAFNFFPRISKRADEFPPSFSSDGFTPTLANRVLAAPHKRSDGFGVISARATRYDLAPRNLEIMHPSAFAELARSLRTSWDEWKDITENKSSAIRVAEHKDGRIFSMNAQASIESLVLPGNRFQARVDISNFYGSIYSHSFPWAIYGVDAAKEARDDGSDWTNQLDKRLREGRRRETTGISIGPGTSAIIGEILLSRVDLALRSQGFEFLRFIDDYYYYGDTREKADSFITAIRQELALLKLTIHPGKTSIRELPIPESPKWSRTLRNVLREPFTIRRVLDFLDEAVAILKEDSENGVLRYAMVRLEKIFADGDLDENGRNAVIARLLHLSFLRPIVVGTLCRLLIASGPEAIIIRAADLNLILREHARALRSDSVTWLLHTLLAANAPIEEATEAAVVDSQDCLSMALLLERSASRSIVEAFLSSFEKLKPTDYRRDEFWLLYYQFALLGKRWDSVPPEYYEELLPLLSAGLSFVRVDSLEEEDFDSLADFLSRFSEYSTPSGDPYAD